MKGIINVLKPTGMSSHDVVNFIRKEYNMKKVGHTGTLDPNAAGVLPICIGKATRVIEYIQFNNKKYRGELTLGAQTDTQDRYGTIINKSTKKVTKDEIIKVFKTFVGEINQIPPMYSAVKKNGKKLYELARQGKTIERDPRRVFIESLEIIMITENKILFDVKCSKGTYIRTLCNDIGEKLGTFGYMSFLTRTNVGCFSIKDSYTIEEISKLSDKMKKDILLSMDYPLKDFKKIKFNNNYYKKLVNGAKIDINRLDIKNINDKEIYRVYCNNIFIGMARIKNNNEGKYLKMNKVLV